MGGVKSCGEGDGVGGGEDHVGQRRGRAEGSEGNLRGKKRPGTRAQKPKEQYQTLQRGQVQMSLETGH